MGADDSVSIGDSNMTPTVSVDADATLTSLSNSSSKDTNSSQESEYEAHTVSSISNETLAHAIKAPAEDDSKRLSSIPTQPSDGNDAHFANDTKTTIAGHDEADTSAVNPLDLTPNTTAIALACEDSEEPINTTSASDTPIPTTDSDADTTTTILPNLEGLGLDTHTGDFTNTASPSDESTTLPASSNDTNEAINALSAPVSNTTTSSPTEELGTASPTLDSTTSTSTANDTDVTSLANQTNSHIANNNTNNNSSITSVINVTIPIASSALPNITSDLTNQTASNHPTNNNNTNGNHSTAGSTSTSPVSRLLPACLEGLKFAEFKAKMATKFYMATRTSSSSTPPTGGSDDNTDSSTTGSVNYMQHSNSQENVFSQLMQKIKALEMADAIYELYATQV